MDNLKAVIDSIVGIASGGPGPTMVRLLIMLCQLLYIYLALTCVIYFSHDLMTLPITTIVIR